MKYVVVLGDGMADEPIESLGGRTPLEAAVTPAMDVLAEMSEIGLVHTIPEGMKPGTFSSGSIKHRRTDERYRRSNPV